MNELKPCPFQRPTDLTDGCAALERIEQLEAELAERHRTCQRVTLGLEREREVATVSWVCSECRAHLSRDDRYCPNCGARVIA